jgi:hypothetical protein
MAGYVVIDDDPGVQAVTNFTLDTGGRGHVAAGSTAMVDAA